MLNQACQIGTAISLKEIDVSLWPPKQKVRLVRSPRKERNDDVEDSSIDVQWKNQHTKSDTVLDNTHFLHSVIEVGLPSGNTSDDDNADTYIIDLSGSQYGQPFPLVPYTEYMNTHVISIETKPNPLGHHRRMNKYLPRPKFKNHTNYSSGNIKNSIIPPATTTTTTNPKTFHEHVTLIIDQALRDWQRYHPNRRLHRLVQLGGGGGSGGGGGAGEANFQREKTKLLDFVIARVRKKMDVLEQVGRLQIQLEGERWGGEVEE